MIHGLKDAEILALHRAFFALVKGLRRVKINSNNFLLSPVSRHICSLLSLNVKLLYS